MIKLNPGIQLAISAFEKSERDVIAGAITRYAEARSISDWFGYVIYRVWNAVKYLFGSSDWQKSVEALKNAVPKLVEQVGHLPVAEGASKENAATQQEFIMQCAKKIRELYMPIAADLGILVTRLQPDSKVPELKECVKIGMQDHPHIGKVMEHFLAMQAKMSSTTVTTLPEAWKHLAEAWMQGMERYTLNLVSIELSPLGQRAEHSEADERLRKSLVERCKVAQEQVMETFNAGMEEFVKQQRAAVVLSHAAPDEVVLRDDDSSAVMPTPAASSPSRGRGRARGGLRGGRGRVDSPRRGWGMGGRRG
jgi:hypothetical protein